MMDAISGSIIFLLLLGLFCELFLAMYLQIVKKDAILVMKNDELVKKDAELVGL
jgi:hypothetical protein